MADAPRKPRAIALVDFQEEILASGRKLLHCIFEDRYSEGAYRWTAPWGEKEKEHGVQHLFFKSLEVEEWNDPDSMWSDELKKAAEEIPALKDFQLPARVECGGLATVAQEEWAYRMQVSITGESNLFSAAAGGPHSTVARCRHGFRVGDCEIDHAKFSDDFVAHFFQKWNLGIGKSVGDVRDEILPCGVFFQVYLPGHLDRQDYRIVGREVASFVRSYLRRVLGDYQTIKRGFGD